MCMIYAKIVIGGVVMISIGFVTNRGWYVARGSGSMGFAKYLHQDGCWRETTAQHGNVFTGYFPSENVAHREAEKFGELIQVLRPG